MECCDIFLALLKELPVIGGVVGGGIALYKWRYDVRMKRIERFHELVKFIREKKHLTEMVYLLDDDSKNKQLQDYLFNLRMYSKKKSQEHGGKTLSFPFDTLVRYGLKNGYLSRRSFEEDYPESWMNDYYAQWIMDENV